MLRLLKSLEKFGYVLRNGRAEMTDFAVAYGAQPETLSGLAGLGDLAPELLAPHAFGPGLQPGCGRRAASACGQAGPADADAGRAGPGRAGRDPAGPLGRAAPLRRQPRRPAKRCV